MAGTSKCSAQKLKSASRTGSGSSVEAQIPATVESVRHHICAVCEITLISCSNRPHARCAGWGEVAGKIELRPASRRTLGMCPPLRRSDHSAPARPAHKTDHECRAPCDGSVLSSHGMQRMQRTEQPCPLRDATYRAAMPATLLHCPLYRACCCCEQPRWGLEGGLPVPRADPSASRRTARRQPQSAQPHPTQPSAGAVGGGGQPRWRAPGRHAVIAASGWPPYAGRA